MKNAGVPAYAKTIDEIDANASAAVGDPKSSKSDLNGPVWGASAGRSWTPTAIVRIKTVWMLAPKAPGNDISGMSLTGAENADDTNPSKP